MTGIYCITNRINNKKYIGSSSYLEKRWKQHRRDLICNRHTNPYLQNSVNKHGIDNFVFETLEVCEKSQLLIREEFWIESHKSYQEKYGFNIHRYPKQTRLGLKASPETILKMSIANGGKNHPMYGKRHSPEHLLNLSRALKGIKKPNSGAKKEFSILNPQGEVVKFVGLRRFCRENNLNVTCAFKLVRGEQAEHRGWKSVLSVEPKQSSRKSSKKVVAICGFKSYYFDSMIAAQRSDIFDNQVFANNITNCCKGKVKSCGKINGKPVSWEYVNDEGVG